MKHVSQAGQTLVEIVIATGIIALVMTAVVSAVAVSIQNSAQAKARALATKYNQEVIELFRRERARGGWDDFMQTLQADGTAITYCLATVPSDVNSFRNLTSGACGATQFVDSRNIFQRSAEITITSQAGKDVVTVTSTVTWNENNKPKKSEMTQVFQEVLVQ